MFKDTSSFEQGGTKGGVKMVTAVRNSPTISNMWREMAR